MKLLKDEAVKVPQVAEFISEGTLKTQRKKAGDAVAAYEVTAFVTDKIDMSVNSPMADRITELLVNIMVKVGQDLFRTVFPNFTSFLHRKD